MRLLLPTTRRVAPEVDADVVVVEASRAVVDADARVVWDERLVLLVGVDVHLRDAVRVGEEVEGLQVRGDLVRRRGDDRAVVLVGAVGIAEGRAAPRAALRVLDDGGPPQQMAGGGHGRGGNRVGVGLSGALLVVGPGRHRNGVRDLVAEVGAVDELDRDDLVALHGGNRVHGERDGVVLPVRRLGEGVPVHELVLDAVERADVRAVGDGAGKVTVVGALRRRIDDVAHRRGAGGYHSFGRDARLDMRSSCERIRSRCLDLRRNEPRERMLSRAVDFHGLSGGDCHAIEREGKRLVAAGRREGDGNSAFRRIQRLRAFDLVRAVPRGDLRNLIICEFAREDLRANLHAGEHGGGRTWLSSSRASTSPFGIDQRRAVEEHGVARTGRTSEDKRDMVPCAVEESSRSRGDGIPAAVRDERAGRVEPKRNRPGIDGVLALCGKKRHIAAGRRRGGCGGEEPEGHRNALGVLELVRRGDGDDIVVFSSGGRRVREVERAHTLHVVRVARRCTFDNGFVDHVVSVGNGRDILVVNKRLLPRKGFF